MLPGCLCTAVLQDKASPAVPSQDTQPLGELQNQMHAPGSHDPAAAAAGGSGKWGVHDKHGHHAGQTDQDLLVRHQHNSLQQPEAYLLSPEAAGTPQSMDLTNDTLQNPGAIGSFPGFSLRDENDSMELGGGDLQGAGCFFAGRDGTYNITGDVPSEFQARGCSCCCRGGGGGAARCCRSKPAMCAACAVHKCRP